VGGTACKGAVTQVSGGIGPRLLVGHALLTRGDSLRFSVKSWVSRVSGHVDRRAHTCRESVNQALRAARHVASL
jgi:hypothetical protein